uniref:Nucleolar protein 5A n=1 Tax=Paramormyrops kingsleyae TaxID=1676925 RepID=A0A3B3T6I0_9TELE
MRVGAALMTSLEGSVEAGICVHFHFLVKGPTDQAASEAQLGLEHSYSRAKVKFNMNRADNMLIQSIAILDQYDCHFPELIKIVSDSTTYCRLVQLISNRKELSEESLAALEDMVMDSAMAQAILEAVRNSMGMDISPIDLINMRRFSSRVVSLAKYRLELQEYLRSKMGQVVPNLATLIGEVVGARLISYTSSLTNLAKYPASTVLILGAEKESQYGLIFHSAFFGRAAANNKGRVSRYPAKKCNITSLIDCISEEPTSVFGDKLRDQVEERLSFYETGETPRKSLDVMKEAVLKAGEEAAEIKQKLEKKEKKQKKPGKKVGGPCYN